MMRVLIALSPRMYCEAMAHSVRHNRPGLDVRCVPPEDAEGELVDFRPHLLVHNDTAPIPEGALEGVSWRVEVLYSDSMSARVVSGGRAEEEVGDIDLGGCSPPSTQRRGRNWPEGRARPGPPRPPRR